MGTIQEDYPDMCPHGWSEYWLCKYCSEKKKVCGCCGK